MCYTLDDMNTSFALGVLALLCGQGLFVLLNYTIRRFSR